ncbi:MAG: YihY/virulence factor BrkB family protein [Thermomicrobiales bacterium]|jgi:YihY family inner membrane protein|nr:MAG: YihY/virulence factor BrkB family protein [Thermomicrobiales bacterium]
MDIYGGAAGGLLANGLAFSSLFASIPTTLLILGLAGWLTGDPAVRQSVVDSLSATFPPLADLFEGALEAMTAGAAFTTFLGIIGIVWTVSQLYGALDVAFARIFRVDPERDIVRRTARGLLVVAILVVAIVGFVVLTTVAAALTTLAPDLPMVGVVSEIAGSLPVLVSLSIGAVLVVYRTLPPRPPGWGAVLTPAVAVGLAIVVLSQVFMFLVPRLVGVAALAGSLASAFVALAWLSFSFQALLYGAAWVRVRDAGPEAAGSAGLGGPAAPAEPGGGGQ